MNMKKIISGFMATALITSIVSVSAFAAVPNKTQSATADLQGLAGTDIMDGDNNLYSNVTVADGKVSVDGVVPNSTLYIQMPTAAQVIGADLVTASDLVDSKLFTFKSSKNTNSSLVKSITFESDTKVGSMRGDWIKVILNDSTMTSEKKFEGKVTFKAKKASNANADNNGFDATTTVYTGDTFELDINLWVNNKGESNGANPGAGDRIYFDPESNEENTLVWGDNHASLRFEANDDASKFYARLSTKADATIYSEFGDPQNADLYFFDFVGRPTIPATSRATLTLGIPWDMDSDVAPNPAECYIYEKDSDGLLTDVTDQFTYSEGDEEIEGWSIKTRTLSSYVISDVELVLDEEISEAPTASSSTSSTGKDIPNTGSSDMVGVAVAAAIVSLAAAGAIAFKKASK